MVVTNLVGIIVLRHHNNPNWPVAVVPSVGTRGGGTATWEPVRVEPAELKPTEEIRAQPLTLDQMLELLSHLKPRVATVEDLKQVLQPFLDAKHYPEESVEAKLRELLASFNVEDEGESVEDRLRKLLADYKSPVREDVESRLRSLISSLKPVNEVSAEDRIRKMLDGYVKNEEFD